MSADATGDGSGAAVLEEALRLLRVEQPAGWTEVSERVRKRLLGVVAPARAFAAHADSGPGRAGSRISISSRVILAELRARLDSDLQVADVLHLVEDRDHRERLGELQVELICRFGADLRGQGTQVRAAAGEVVRELLGRDPGFDPGRDVLVHVADLVTGDPRQT